MYSAEVLAGIAGNTYIGNSAKAKHELGFAPRDLASGFRDAVAHEMRQLGMPLPKALQRLGEADSQPHS